METSFNDFLNQAWNDHATQSPRVAARIEDGIRLISQGDQIPLLANLVAHVFGEHLGRWNDGIETLRRLRAVPVYEAESESEKAILRSIASLELAAGTKTSVEDFSPSDQIRILAVTAAALSEQKDAERAQSLFLGALEIAQKGLSKDDPANRALAVTGNNLASALEGKATRSAAETELMVLAAQTGRKCWEVAGTWLQVERAEYRLSQTYLKAGDGARARVHAEACLRIATDNNAPALELFFGYEALALAERALGRSAEFTTAVERAKGAFAQLSEKDQSWCSATLKKMLG